MFPRVAGLNMPLVVKTNPQNRLQVVAVLLTNNLHFGF
jgi:hypothetical protein